MSRKRYSPEKIIGMLREAEVALSPRDDRWPNLPSVINFRANLLSLAQSNMAV